MNVISVRVGQGRWINVAADSLGCSHRGAARKCRTFREALCVHAAGLPFIITSPSYRTERPEPSHRQAPGSLERINKYSGTHI